MATMIRRSCAPTSRWRYGLLAALLAQAGWALAQTPAAPARDEFFWLGAINKATAVINTDEGLLDRQLAPRLAAGIDKVLADGGQPGGARPRTVISFEPLLIKAAGPEVTWLHAGRSSQDMHATYRAAILRDELLVLATELNRTTEALVKLADKHQATIVPNYTNGVAAQPNSLGHNLLGHAAGLERDAQRLREAYARIDRSAMGTTVLNGSSWPLNRRRMADYLGFAGTVDNAYDASQISSMEHPVEVGAVVTAIALHAGHFIEDVMVQYAAPRPWMLLAEGDGNTYVSSAMPQKRNPGLLNSTRRQASGVIAVALGPVIRAHNITPGMADPKEVQDNSALVRSTVAMLKGWQRILGALVVSPERALEELDSDWTASQELADLLMRQYQVPFRMGHHFASDLVDHARQNNLRPSNFPYATAREIYARTLSKDGGNPELPMSEAEFKAALDPVAIVRARATAGGPQPAEMVRMLSLARQQIQAQSAWIAQRQQRIQGALAQLDTDFKVLLPKP